MLPSTPDQRALDLIRRIALAKRNPKTDPRHIEKLESDLRNRIELLKSAHLDDRGRALRLYFESLDARAVRAHKKEGDETR